MGYEAPLVVEADDADVRLALKCLVSSTGFAAETFASGAGSLHAIEGHEPDCLVPDLRMPEMSGFDVRGVPALGHPVRSE